MKLQMKSEEQVESENGVGQDMQNNWLWFCIDDGAGQTVRRKPDKVAGWESLGT